MTWPTLHAIMTSTRCEFAPWLAKKHNFVRLLSGRWSRVLGAPASNTRHIRGRIYHMVAS